MLAAEPSSAPLQDLGWGERGARRGRAARARGLRAGPHALPSRVPLAQGCTSLGAYTLFSFFFFFLLWNNT